jgi:hypothetical protein
MTDKPSRLYRRRKGLPATTRRASRGEPMAFAIAALNSSTTECILWPYAVNKMGYGLLSQHRVAMHAHRWMCIKANGEPPSAAHEARHSCHVPECVNPAHLTWGTHTENMHDSIRAGRNAVGERHTKSRLTDVVVTEIRQSKIPDAIWARRLGVSDVTVALARAGKTWKHVLTPPRRDIRSESARYREQMRKGAAA